MWLCRVDGRQDITSRFKGHGPDQADLLPLSIFDELGGQHLCILTPCAVERPDLSCLRQSYRAEGGSLDPPELGRDVWFYAYALGLTSARQLERRLIEDLALYCLATRARVDNWTLSAFRRRHARALNDSFAQVLEMAIQLGLARLGQMAID